MEINRHLGMTHVSKSRGQRGQDGGKVSREHEEVLGRDKVEWRNMSILDDTGTPGSVPFTAVTKWHLLFNMEFTTCSTLVFPDPHPLAH